MRERVFGIETEYATVFHPEPGRGAPADRPLALHLFALFELALRRRVRTLPNALSLLRPKLGRFLENGGTFHYEASAEGFEHGLVEMASPECRDPFRLLAYERAKDELVEELAVEVSEEVRALGYRGEVRIGKNNLDSQGHTFGSHESYWIDDPLPLAARLALLPAWAALWALSVPVLAFVIGVQLAVFLGMIGGAVVLAASALLLQPLLPRVARSILSLLYRLRERLESNPGSLLRKLRRLELLVLPLVWLHARLYDVFFFRAVRRELTAFLVTRSIFCGAGRVAFDGGPLYRVAQRPPFLRALSGIFAGGDARPLYETRDLFHRPWSALGRRRRLHLLVGDANLCEWAQCLRVGTTALVLEAIEAGALSGAPRLARPLEALRAVGDDVSLRVRLELADGTTATALELQRLYLAAARRAVAGAGVVETWKARVLRAWEETLDLLERDPARLADRVDWIAKRRLVLAEAPDPADRTALERKGARLLRDGGEGEAGEPRLRELGFRVWRADLRYHELSPRGGFRRLERAGRVLRLTSEPDVVAARREPPPDTRARARGRAILWAHARALGGSAAWHRVRIGKLDWRFFRDPLDPGSDPVLRSGR